MPNTRYILLVLVCVSCFHVTNVRTAETKCEERLCETLTSFNTSQEMLFQVTNNLSTCQQGFSETLASFNVTQQMLSHVTNDASTCEHNLNISNLGIFELHMLQEDKHEQYTNATTTYTNALSLERRVKNIAMTVLAFILSCVCVCVDTWLCHNILNLSLRNVNKQRLPFDVLLYLAYVGCFCLLAYSLNGDWALFTNFYIFMGLSAMAMNVVWGRKFYLRTNVLNIGLECTSTHRNVLPPFEVMQTRVRDLHIHCTKIALCFVFLLLFKFIFIWICTWVFKLRLPDLQNELRLFNLTQSFVVPIWICLCVHEGEVFEWTYTWKASWKLTRGFLCTWLHTWKRIYDKDNITLWLFVWFMFVNESRIELFLSELWLLIRPLCEFIWSCITSVSWSSSWRDSPFLVAIGFFFAAVCATFTILYLTPAQ